MRIKRLDICGFKSFMDRTVFVFDEGVTGVVGPNGCGKSNVVDAIRWVMGEQSAKHLRGRSMEDVIFNGSERHAPLGMAEVSITFLNDRNDVPAQYQGLSEITVTRRLFRNGDSEYLINKVACRLLDIVELFLGTGVGTKAYSIIEQGRIGLIVSAKPEDRRQLIEEAAGITKYKARRKAAERKMEFTEQNLLRVGDILGELGKRLEALDRQARKAEKYKRLKGEMREIELHLASAKWLELQALRKVASARREELAREETARGERVEALEAEIAAAREALAVRARELEERTAAAAALEKGTALTQTNLEFYDRERAGVLDRQEELRGEIASIDARLAVLDEETARARETLDSLSGAGGEDQARGTELAATLEEAREAEKLAAARLEEERSGAMAILSEAAARKGELITIDRRRGDLIDRLARLQGEVDELEDESGRLERERAALAEKAGERRQLKLELESRRSDALSAQDRVRQELAEAETELIGLREELADKRSRLTSLLEIQRSYEGLDRGVRAVMTHGATGEDPPEGVFGLVSDLLETDADHERAIEAVLGERLQGVVVENHELAGELVHYLADAREGRGTFLPLSLRSEPALDPIDHPAFVARAVDVVRASTVPAPLVEALLGDVAIVRDLPSALELWEAGLPHTLVTLEGQVVAPTGAVTGGDGDGPGAGLLQKRREIAELTEVVRALENRVGLAAERHRKFARHAEELERSLKDLDQTGHAEELNLVHAEKDLSKITDELQRVRARIETLARDREDLENGLALLDVEAESARGAAAQAEGERARREERIAMLSAELSAVRERASELEARATELKVQAAAQAERREAAERTVARAATEREEARERRSRAEGAIAAGEARLVELEQRCGEARGNVTSLADELQAAQESLAAERAEHERQLAEVAAREEALRTERAGQKEAVTAAGDAAVEDRELALAIQHLVDGIAERHNLVLAQQVYDYHQRPLPPEGTEARLATLREQVERMGEVNLTAVEEHEELKKRHSFLAAQKDDLEQSLAALRQAIVRIDRTSKERFEETFRIVDEKFQQVFPRLFGGGKGQLQLTPGEDGREAGVDVLAQPPGKKLQSVTLMSGGEKALTAVSLIFAIFLIKPTPFCLLDEVDAPLDDANVGRYNAMVKEMSKTSQFILITHNKTTMEIADTIYGVTMEEPGVSKTVSVRFHNGEDGQGEARAS